MDRTNELIKLVQVLDVQKRVTHGTHRPLSQYTRIATQISDALKQNEQLIAQLLDLVNRKSILNDPTEEITSISNIFKRDIGIITEDIDRFHKVINNSSRQCMEHYSVIVNSLRTRMSHCAKKFQAALEQRTTILKEQSNRRSKFSHAGRSPLVQMNAPMFQRQQAAIAPPINQVSQPRRKEQAATPSTRSDSLASPPGNNNGSGSSDQVPQAVLGPTPFHPHPMHMQYPEEKSRQNPFAFSKDALSTPTVSQQDQGLRRRAQMMGAPPYPHQSQGHQQMQQTMFYQSTSAQDRLQNATQVESTIVELSGMFTRMANMVAEQGELVTRIDDDMDLTLGNVEAGQNELLKYFKTMSGNRSLIIKIFLVLIVLIFMFVVVFR